jgi:hypothetical protein
MPLACEAHRALRPDRPGVEDLLGIINTGYRHGATRPVLVPTKGGGWDADEMTAVAKVVAANLYMEARSKVAKTLRKYPLRLLQRVPGGSGDPSDAFLYVDRWMEGSKEEIAAHGEVIHLHAGVATALARLSGMLIPTINTMWVEKVQDLNPNVSVNVPDFNGYLFGHDRKSLQRPATALKKAFGDQWRSSSAARRAGNRFTPDTFRLA